MKLFPHYLFLQLLCLPAALAWGGLGHNTTGYLASYFVSSSTRAYLQDLLGNQNDDYLAEVASWADAYRNKPEGRFSNNFHFIDAHDNPAQNSCQVDYARDCKQGGCIISALVNYTERARDRLLPEPERQKAFKFLVHFIGDLHQPLHNEDVARGATRIQVSWGRFRDNLHAVWDTRILDRITEHLGAPSKRTAMRWADMLAREITNGKYATEKQKWLEKVSSDKSEFFPPGLRPEQIAHKNLYANGYYDQAAPVVEAQIARAGFRTAVWLDNIVDSLEADEGSNETGDDEL